MYLKQIADEIGDSVNDTTLKSTGSLYSRTKQWINEFMFQDFLTVRDWWFTQKEGLVTTVAQYATGTATFTNGSTTVTGSGTSWTTTYENRYIVIDGEIAYKITDVASTTSLTLETAYEGTTGSKTYRIIKYRYNLPRWVDFPLRISQFGSPNVARNLTSYLRNSIARPFYQYEDYAQGYVPGPRERSTYTTGTVSGMLNEKTLTGDSTAWLTSGIEQYDLIQIGSVVYTVNSVDSNTQITLFEDINTAISTGSSYTALLDRYTIDFVYFPTEAHAIPFRANAIVSPLVNDYDVPILPTNWHWILVKGGRVRALQHNGEDITLAAAELQASINKLISINDREVGTLERIRY